MDIFWWGLLLVGAWMVLKGREERRRIALLGRHLGKYQIERLMEHITHGYHRALAESEPARREHIWQLLEPQERQLSEQLSRLAADVAQEPEAEVRVNRWPVPYLEKLWPGASCDLRKMLAVHAAGIEAVATNRMQYPLKDRAYTFMAELLLMQHTCHWFCKSLPVASARMLARHRTTHAQALESVLPGTRAAYLSVLQGCSR